MEIDCEYRKRLSSKHGECLKGLYGGRPSSAVCARICQKRALPAQVQPAPDAPPPVFKSDCAALMENRLEICNACDMKPECELWQPHIKKCYREACVKQPNFVCPRSRFGAVRKAT